MGPIKRLKSVHIQTPALERSVAFYTEGYGLSLRSEDGQVAEFEGAHGEGTVLKITKGSPARLVGLTVGMAEPDLAAAKAELEGEGLVTGSDAAPSFWVEDPDGNRVEIVPDTGDPDETPTGDGRPLFVSHAVLNSPDPERLTKFFTETLGFRIADMYEKGLLTFLRAHQPQHHCIGVSPGEAASLNHFSVDVGSIDGLMRSIGRMKKAGFEPIWGPGRHGPGGNVFCYFEDPTGFVAEFTCDVIQIEDDDAWVPKEWPRVPDTANVWGTGGPTPRAVSLMSGEPE